MEGKIVLDEPPVGYHDAWIHAASMAGTRLFCGKLVASLRARQAEVDAALCRLPNVPRRAALSAADCGPARITGGRIPSFEGILKANAPEIRRLARLVVAARTKLNDPTAGIGLDDDEPRINGGQNPGESGPDGEMDDDFIQSIEPFAKRVSDLNDELKSKIAKLDDADLEYAHSNVMAANDSNCPWDTFAVCRMMKEHLHAERSMRSAAPPPPDTDTLDDDSLDDTEMKALRGAR